MRSGDELKVEINSTDNAAFADGNCNSEVARILRGAADHIEQGCMDHPALKDINGNPCGTISIREGDRDYCPGCDEELPEGENFDGLGTCKGCGDRLCSSCTNTSDSDYCADCEPEEDDED